MNCMRIVVSHYKDNFRNYDKVYRVAEIMDIIEIKRDILFNSWYSNWFIFFPIFLYKAYRYDKEMKSLDNELDIICKFLEKN